MAKRPSLSALRSAAKGTASSSSEHGKSSSSSGDTEATSVPPLELQRRRRQASREGLKSVTFYISEEAHESLAIMAIKKRRTQENLLKEALNDLLSKYGENPIA